MVAVAYVIPKVVVSRACEVGEPWMALHQQLLSIARRRAALDSEELGAIREAIRVQLWRRFGMTSLREYLEHFMGSLDAPQRPKGAVPAAIERAVRQRDGYCCTVPGCQSARLLHAHHIVWQSRGAGHEMENLTLLCAGHHGAVHRGEIAITGKAPALVMTRKCEVPHVGDPASAIASAEAIRACARENADVPHVGDLARRRANRSRSAPAGGAASRPVARRCSAVARV